MNSCLSNWVVHLSKMNGIINIYLRARTHSHCHTQHNIIRIKNLIWKHTVLHFLLEYLCCAWVVSTGAMDKKLKQKEVQWRKKRKRLFTLPFKALWARNGMVPCLIFFPHTCFSSVNKSNNYTFCLWLQFPAITSSKGVEVRDELIRVLKRTLEKINIWGLRTPFLFLEWIGLNAMLVFVMATQGIFARFIKGWYYKNPDNNLEANHWPTGTWIPTSFTNCRRWFSRVEVSTRWELDGKKFEELSFGEACRFRTSIGCKIKAKFAEATWWSFLRNWAPLPVHWAPSVH